jgi:Sortase domain
VTNGRHGGSVTEALPQRTDPSAVAGRRRLRRLLALLVAALLGVGATLWAVNASGSRPPAVLSVSRPKAADLPATSPGAAHRVGDAGPVGKSTPAQVGRAAPSQLDSERPLAVRLPSGTTMRVRASATSTNGALEIPSDIKRAGWWDGGARLGDPFGAIVVAAHVDSFTQGLGRFAELLSMKPGDVVGVRSTHLAEDFQVVSARLVPKTSISATSPAFSGRGESRLVLITCGGQYDPARGGYQSNMVVVAISPHGANRTG